MIVEDQSEVIAFLSRPEAYGLDPQPVERHETHASVIFLAGSSAFKLKRAVRYPYLDYSTRLLRHRFCCAEVETNRRIAPDVYRGVRAIIRQRDGRLALGTLDALAGAADDADAIDWVIEMARFDQDALFDHLAAAGRLDRFAMESLADGVAQFHAEARRCPDSGGAAGITRVLDSNRSCFAAVDPAVLDESRSRLLVDREQATLQQVAALLERRREEGFVRHCHGDLHLRNIVVRDGRAVLFDAIEFDPAFAEIDVLYDLAFLVMDLQARGLPRLASILLNRYLDNTGDAGGLEALPLFLSLRAAIRSHVDAAAAMAMSVPEDAAASAEAARRYRDLALSFLEPAQPSLVAIGGLSGSGKSRLARDLAPHLGPAPGARVVRTDTTRKRLAGVALGTRLGPRDYGDAMTRRTYQAVYDEAAVALASGRSVIADAVFARPAERVAIADIAKTAGVPFVGLWLQAQPRLLESRVTGRRNNASDATAEVVRLQLSYDLGDIPWQRLDSSGSEEETLSTALAVLANGETAGGGPA